jgi:hypothetical protein
MARGVMQAFGTLELPLRSPILDDNGMLLCQLCSVLQTCHQNEYNALPTLVAGKILETSGGMDDVTAEVTLKKLESTGRYQQDLYS